MNTGGIRGNRHRPLKMRTFPGHKGKWYKIPLIESLAKGWKVYKKVITSSDRARQKEETRKELEQD